MPPPASLLYLALPAAVVSPFPPPASPLSLRCLLLLSLLSRPSARTYHSSLLPVLHLVHVNLDLIICLLWLSAVGIFGAEQGQLLTSAQQEEQFAVLDRDGDGEVSFDEFQAWWKGMEADNLMEGMDKEEIESALEDAGIETQTGQGDAVISEVPLPLPLHHRSHCRVTLPLQCRRIQLSRHRSPPQISVRGRV